MNRKAVIFNDNRLAGYLEKTNQGTYTFQYYEDYLKDPDALAISLSFPKSVEVYRSEVLFPFFFGLLSEGVNKQTQCRLLKIDENDHFKLLLHTVQNDTIGAITVKEITE